MRREPEFFGDQELSLIYMATRLKEALAVEEALNAGGVDYAVLPQPFTSGFLFRSNRVGAFFYVAPGSESAARAWMRQHGIRPQRA